MCQKSHVSTKYAQTFATSALLYTHTLLSTCKENGIAQHKSNNSLSMLCSPSLSFTRQHPSERGRRCCSLCQLPMRSVAHSYQKCVWHFSVSAFVLLLILFRTAAGLSLPLSLRQFFGCCCWCRLGLTLCWLFGDACLFLSSFAPCDDGPAKFCPCFKNCSVLNFLLFGFIIRTRTHTHTHVQARVHTFRSRRNNKFHVVVVDLAIFLKLLLIKHRSIRFYIAMTAANLRLQINILFKIGLRIDQPKTITTSRRKRIRSKSVVFYLRIAKKKTEKGNNKKNVSFSVAATPASTLTLTPVEKRRRTGVAQTNCVAAKSTAARQRQRRPQ